MTRKLTRTGNSDALTITRDMKDHLGITDEVDVQFLAGKIVLKRPMTIEEASARSDEKFKGAYKRLAK